MTKKKVKELKKKPMVKVEEKTPKEIMYEAICPTCKKGVETHKCRLCGATKTINQVSGQMIWMRNGRIVAAYKDDKIAWVKMAIANNIPKDKWPDRFRD